MVEASQRPLGDSGQCLTSVSTTDCSSQEQHFNSDAGGGQRTFRIYVPRSYIKGHPMPLILAFHGHGQAASTFESETQFSDPSVNNDSIVVYPQGLKVRNIPSRQDG